MLVLLDNNVPRGVARALTNHSVTEARERGGATMRNDDLLRSAEDAGFDVLVTADKNIRYQQNLAGRKIALVGSHTTALGARQAAVAANFRRSERVVAREFCSGGHSGRRPPINDAETLRHCVGNVHQPVLD